MTYRVIQFALTVLNIRQFLCIPKIGQFSLHLLCGHKNFNIEMISSK